jgi:hypothetical protein
MSFTTFLCILGIVVLLIVVILFLKLRSLKGRNHDQPR